MIMAAIRSEFLGLGGIWREVVVFSADPPPVQLIVQFLEQASKPSVNEQNQVQPPPDNKRNRILKLLALKVAAHLKWDLDVLEKRYGLCTLHMEITKLRIIESFTFGTTKSSYQPDLHVIWVLHFNKWKFVLLPIWAVSFWD